MIGLHKAKRADNGEWVEGFLVFDEFDKQYRIVIKLEYSTGTHIDTGFAPRVDKSTICRYTGLNDKNGNKIWENDVVKVEDWIGKVIWFDNDTAFYVLANDDIEHETYCLGYHAMENGVEVIGNIFDNPELLEGQV